MDPILVLIIQRSIYYIIPLSLVAFGGMFSERSGIVNIALEGLMLFGAFGAMLFISMNQIAGSTMSPQLMYILAMLIASATGVAASLLHAFASINMKADQVISGTAINMLAPALIITLARTWQESGLQQVTVYDAFKFDVPLLKDIPILGELLFQNVYISTYIGIVLLIILAIILNKTSFGLRLRACGENPQAADSSGINVYKYRYAGVIISGALAGVGGFLAIIVTSPTLDGTVNGYGFLALAILIFGQWKPSKIVIAAVFFAILRTLSAVYDSVGFLNSLGLPGDVYRMLPYIVTLVVLAFTSKRSRAPKAAGVVYDKGLR